MYIPQIQLNRLQALCAPGKVAIVYGPRRVGKTTLLKKFLENESDYLFVTGEDLFVGEYLASGSIEKLKEFIGDKSLLVIDEAQYISSIGLNLKLIVDHIPHVRVIATGSSTFDLVKNVGEPLTGRKNVIKMYPVSQIELGNLETKAQTKSHLESRLIFGSYPEVITHTGDEMKMEYLHELVSSYLIKDILAFEGIQKSKKIIDLLILLSFQIGKEVSHTELGNQLQLSRVTVEKYLDLLEQTFVLINIRGFSRNLRKEMTKKAKYYFYDNGIRNALVANFNTLTMRNDTGQLWENFLMMERIKKQSYEQYSVNRYFWRTWDQKEIDLIEDHDGNLSAFEFKWTKQAVSAPKDWVKNYADAQFSVIDRDNYLEYIL